ncbi:MAG TPA: hypothetical protein VNO21_23720, partial [Polyangiaceae bacterium]|nr:hypothetical protein [Polyangiaceae bacterium]
DAVTLKLELRDAAGAAQPDVALFLSQDADGYLAFSENVVTTDATGRASVKVALARMPPAGSGRVFKTVSAGAIVSLPNGDSQDVSGSIILEVPRS